MDNMDTHIIISIASYYIYKEISTADYNILFLFFFSI